MRELPLRSARILIVDDQEVNVHLLKRVLRGAGYTNYLGITDPRQVFSACAEAEPDLILLDLYMPYLDGFAVMRQLAVTNPDAPYLPILVLTADISPEVKLQALMSGAKDFLTKPADNAEILLRIKNLLETRFLHLELQRQNDQLDARLKERTRDLEAAQYEILERLARASEYRDDQTGRHTQRVGEVSGLIADALGLPSDQVEIIRRAALLHDVGKIGIPDHILLKPGKLTPEEFDQMKGHTTMGASVLAKSRFPILKMAERIAYSHHERYDGTGYPLGLRGEEIPLVGRIVAAADTFDALTHARPYKVAWPVSDAVAEIKSQSGRQFDPQVVAALTSVLDRIPAPRDGE